MITLAQRRKTTLRHYKVAIVYCSNTGNTKEVALGLSAAFQRAGCKVDVYGHREFYKSILHEYDAVILGTYTWGDGEIPEKFKPVVDEFKHKRNEFFRLVTGVFGTGETCYPKFCGAVDHIEIVLYTWTDLTVTLKVEQSPQQSDMDKFPVFVNHIIKELEYLDANPDYRSAIRSDKITYNC